MAVVATAKAAWLDTDDGNVTVIPPSLTYTLKVHWKKKSSNSPRLLKMRGGADELTTRPPPLTVMPPLEIRAPPDVTERPPASTRSLAQKRKYNIQQTYTDIA